MPPFGGFPVLERVDCVSDVGEDVFAALVHGYLGCTQVGHALMGLRGSASVRVHSRSLVLYGQSQGP
ncbi:hypothetical protein AY485_10140 [Corynebacterium diphtheriae bv. gravis]|nr:hypothetical protein AY485_10140 [Corynebacterium diphtheriae bv. gravis]